MFGDRVLESTRYPRRGACVDRRVTVDDPQTARLLQRAQHRDHVHRVPTRCTEQPEEFGVRCGTDGLDRDPVDLVGAQRGQGPVDDLRSRHQPVQQIPFWERPPAEEHHQR
ncbi:hypothetical protein [Gordonia hongkongensis]|uniref:hypothetical protein n=1 Tax=Gordonia hongkongensis TaxID=1701090 RepID=UPI001FFA8BE9|nr:hypothetical protein [Gordonia hongkongensis]UPG70727.1 hypothetical protein MVF96_00995 [Gordonia hongkongensis]